MNFPSKFIFFLQTLRKSFLHKDSFYNIHVDADYDWETKVKSGWILLEVADFSSYKQNF